MDNKELDVFLAEKVMKWRLEEDMVDQDSETYISHWYDKDGNQLLNEWLWHPTEDIAQARMVLSQFLLWNPEYSLEIEYSYDEEDNEDCLKVVLKLHRTIVYLNCGRMNEESLYLCQAIYKAISN